MPRMSPERAWAHRRRPTHLDNRDPLHQDRTSACRERVMRARSGPAALLAGVFQYAGDGCMNFELDGSHAVRTYTTTRFSRALLVLALVLVGLAEARAQQPADQPLPAPPP